MEQRMTELFCCIATKLTTGTINMSAPTSAECFWKRHGHLWKRKQQKSSLFHRALYPSYHVFFSTRRWSCCSGLEGTGWDSQSSCIINSWFHQSFLLLSPTSQTVLFILSTGFHLHPVLGLFYPLFISLLSNTCFQMLECIHYTL